MIDSGEREREIRLIGTTDRAAATPAPAPPFTEVKIKSTLVDNVFIVSENNPLYPSSIQRQLPHRQLTFHLYGDPLSSRTLPHLFSFSSFLLCQQLIYPATASPSAPGFHLFRYSPLRISFALSDKSLSLHPLTSFLRKA